MSNMTKKITGKRVISAMTIGALLIALQTTGVLGGFWRTLGDMTGSKVNPNSYEYGYGYGDLGWGYGYGYGYGNKDKFGYGTVTDVTTTSDTSVVGSNNATVTIPTGTKITNTTNTPIGDIVSETIPNPSSPSGVFKAIEIYPRDANGNRISGVTLKFSKPVKIDFNTTTSMTVAVDHGTGYGYVGLTTSATATCNADGSANPAYTGTEITNGIIYTCSASKFAASNYSTSTGGSSSGGGGGGGGVSTPTCKNSQLVCKKTGSVYKLFRQEGVNCKNGNLGKSCVITDGSVKVTNPVNNTDTTRPVVVPVNNAIIPVNPSTESLNVSDTLNGKITVVNGVATLNSCEFVVKKHTFLDDDTTFATKYITILQELGIVNGRDGNGQLFMPESNTTRTEFLKMTLRIFCKDYSSTDTSGLPFSDVNKLDWKAKVIAKALSEGLITAQNSKFRPNDAISRIEAIKILTLASGLEVNPTNTTVFSDVTVNWMKKYVETARNAGIVNGQTVNGKLIFEPLRSITRAEASKIIINGVKVK